MQWNKRSSSKAATANRRFEIGVVVAASTLSFPMVRTKNPNQLSILKPPNLFISSLPLPLSISKLCHYSSQDYLKTVVPSQLIAERGPNLVVINPGTLTLPPLFLSSFTTIILQSQIRKTRRFCKYQNRPHYTRHSV